MPAKTVGNSGIAPAWTSRVNSLQLLGSLAAYVVGGLLEMLQPSPVWIAAGKAAVVKV